MAKKGLKYLRWGQLVSDADPSALPTYNPEKTYVLGRLNAADYTPLTSSGRIHGDDEIAEESTEIIGATIATVLTELLEDASVAMFGETKDTETGEISSTTSDNPPLGGLAYYGIEQVRGANVYTGYFYPHVKAVTPSEALATKGDSITFGTIPVTFNASSSANGTVRVRKSFSNEADCRTWVEEKLPATVTTTATTNTEA